MCVCMCVCVCVCPYNINQQDTLLLSINLFQLYKALIKPVVVKSKAIPLQAWTGPEGSRRGRLPDFKTVGT